ncbi:hypothetical protein DV736_g4235, partial [Chaetothyriales sp. CBS 134916]
MAKTFEESLLLQPDPTLPSTFTNIHTPWTWPFTKVVPGGTLMALSAAAARTTLASSSTTAVLNNLQIHFLAGPNSRKPITFTVNTVSSGRRFQVRSVNVSQEGKPMCFVTCTFMIAGAWRGKSMKHTTSRATAGRLSRITIDDLSPGRSPDAQGHHSGPFMAFQRLPLVVVPDSSTNTHRLAGSSGPKPKPSPQQIIAPVACHITPAITSSDPFMQVLGVLSLSDYHVLDFPPTVHAISFGLAPIGEPVENIQLPQFKLFTSLNHTIHFEHNDGLRADEMTYVEVTGPWARDGRAVINSKIFTEQGSLIATCVQEAYYVLIDDAESGIGSKL